MTALDTRPGEGVKVFRSRRASGWDRVVMTWLHHAAAVSRASVAWLDRHPAWTWWFVLAGLLAWRSAPTRLTAGALVLGAGPAVVTGWWSSLRPGSYRHRVSDPWRRFMLRSWGRRNWRRIARASGLSVQVERRPFFWGLLRRTEHRRWAVKRWIDPQLITAIATGSPTTGSVLTLRVRARLGQSVEEITAVAPRLRDGARASAIRCVQHSPSVLDVVLVLGDPLAEMRTSTAAAALPWNENSGSDLVVLGRGEDGTDVVVDPTEAWHYAVQGATRSGKSALSYTLLGTLAGRSDVLVCGVDPSGILLSPFTYGRGGAWIATGTADTTRAVTALAGVVAEMDARIARLVAAGADKLDTFTPACPLLLVVLEEYPGTLAAARSDDEATGRRGETKTAPQIERAVGRLVKEGAKVGVRLLVLAQRMSARAVDTDDRSNFGVRITLRVDNADAVAMLHDGPAARAQAEATRQFPPGMGLLEGPGRPLQRWRADFTDYPTYRAQVAAGIAATEVPDAFTTHPTAPEQEEPA